jgi:hypothetical protein
MRLAQAPIAIAESRGLLVFRTPQAAIVRPAARTRESCSSRPIDSAAPPESRFRFGPDTSAAARAFLANTKWQVGALIEEAVAHAPVCSLNCPILRAYLGLLQRCAS